MTRTRNTNIKNVLRSGKRFGIYVEQHAITGKPLGFVDGGCISIGKIRSLFFVQLNRAPFFVLKRQFFTLHGFHREAVAVGNVQRFIVTRYHDLIARRQFGADCLVYRQLGVCTRAESDLLTAAAFNRQFVARPGIKNLVRLAPLHTIFVILFGDNDLPFTEITAVAAFRLCRIHAVK
ncbi:Uncharacterised protein [Salmonella enterica subsp. enterica serovar Typhi]|nr:Uncharacterised protein [Salmonella enterica subsp. enterica serovar Typhi]SYK25985.1 Uncharacterised protein [Klebsiella pneumoniae]